MDFEEGCDYCNQYQCGEQCHEAKRDMALKKIRRVSEKMGEFSRNNPIVQNGLSLIWRGDSTEDTLCRIIEVLSESNERVTRDALTIATGTVNGTVTMVFEDSALHNKMIHESIKKDAEIECLRQEISTLRNMSRVRVADGFRGGE